MASNNHIEMLNKAVLCLKLGDWPKFRYTEYGYNVYKGNANIVIHRTEHFELTYNLGMICRVPIDDLFFKEKIPKILPPHMIVKHVKYDFLPELIETRTFRK